LRYGIEANITDLLARAGLGIGEFAELAGVDRSIFYRAGRPLRPKTAWKIANAYAARATITPEQAYERLIAEESQQAAPRSDP
jgi:hypothetical protein